MSNHVRTARYLCVSHRWKDIDSIAFIVALFTGFMIIYSCDNFFNVPCAYSKWCAVEPWTHIWFKLQQFNGFIVHNFHIKINCQSFSIKINGFGTFSTTIDSIRLLFNDGIKLSSVFIIHEVLAIQNGWLKPKTFSWKSICPQFAFLMSKKMSKLLTL